MIKDIIKIDNELCSFVEALAYEVEAKKSVIAEMIDTGRSNSSAFKDYESEYREIYVRFQIAKEEIEEKYILSNPKYKGENVTWNLIYKTNEITVTGTNDNTKRGCANC